MATITKRNGRWQARVRRKGYQSVFATEKRKTKKPMNVKATISSASKPLSSALLTFWVFCLASSLAASFSALA